jgi:hypothetical protein
MSRYVWLSIAAWHLDPPSLSGFVTAQQIQDRDQQNLFHIEKKDFRLHKSIMFGEENSFFILIELRLDGRQNTYKNQSKPFKK